MKRVYFSRRVIAIGISCTFAFLANAMDQNSSDLEKQAASLSRQKNLREQRERRLQSLFKKSSPPKSKIISTSQDAINNEDSRNALTQRRQAKRLKSIKENSVAKKVQVLDVADVKKEAPTKIAKRLNVRASVQLGRSPISKQHSFNYPVQVEKQIQEDKSASFLDKKTSNEKTASRVKLEMPEITEVSEEAISSKENVKPGTEDKYETKKISVVVLSYLESADRHHTTRKMYDEEVPVLVPTSGSGIKTHQLVEQVCNALGYKTGEYQYFVERKETKQRVCTTQYVVSRVDEWKIVLIKLKNEGLLRLRVCTLTGIGSDAFSEFEIPVKITSVKNGKPVLEEENFKVWLRLSSFYPDDVLEQITQEMQKRGFNTSNYQRSVVRNVVMAQKKVGKNITNTIQVKAEKLTKTLKPLSESDLKKLAVEFVQKK